MEIINWPRRGGKTHYLIQQLLNNDKYVLITHSETERKRLLREYIREYKKHKLENRIFVWETAYHKLLGLHNIIILVDNADLILQQILRLPIKTVSITDER